MGVAGSGKTTVGKQLAKDLDGQFLDADAFHPTENITKMMNGIPLNDDDRISWLLTLNKSLKSNSRSRVVIVLACSALKAKYRDILSEGVPVTFIYLNVAYRTAIKRLEKRKEHFFNLNLLQSQFDTLEKPSNAIEVDANMELEHIMNEINTKLSIAP